MLILRFKLLSLKYLFAIRLGKYSFNNIFFLKRFISESPIKNINYRSLFGPLVSNKM